MIKKTTCILSFLIFASASIYAQLSITSSGTLFTIDFDSTLVGVNEGAFMGAGFTTTPATGQLNSNAVVAGGFSEGSVAYGGSATTGDFAKGVSAGAIFSGGIYAFETNASSPPNTALGVQPTGSDWTPGTLGLQIVNQTDSTIESITISYDIYVNNDQARGNDFNFAHSSDDIVYIDEPTLDYTSIEMADALGFVAIPRSITITGLSIPVGGSYYFQWKGDDNTGGGSRDEFGLDNINISVATSATVTCGVSDIQALNTGSCNDNSTPNNIADDFFTSDILVTFVNAPTTGDLELYLSSDTSLVSTVAVTMMDSTTGHTFVGLTFAADGNDVGLIARFSDDTTCTRNEPSLIPGVFPCPPITVFELSQADSCFEINFDSPVPSVNDGQYDGTGFSPTPTAGQINSNTFIITGLQDGDLNYGDFGVAGDFAKGVSTGGISSGGAYAFEVAPGDRALGVQPTGSDWTPGTYEMRFVNSTGAAITDLSVAYDIYYLNDATRGMLISFSHSANDTTFINEPSLDFGTPLPAAANPIWLAENKSIILSGLNIPDGDMYYIKWSGADIGSSGSNDEIAIDNIVFNAGGALCVDTTCNISLVAADSIYPCNDGGTPNDITDDFFAADIIVNFSNATSTGTLDVFIDNEVTPSLSVDVSMLDSANTHTFDSIIFAITGNDYVLTAVFSDDTDCILSNPSGVPSQLPCSTVPCAMAGDIIITEFMANPTDVGDGDGEYFELYNRSNDTFNLFTYFVTDLGSDAFVIDQSLIIAPGEFLVMARSGNTNLTADFVYGDDMNLGNASDDIILRCPDSTLVTSLTYADGDPFGAGVALEFSCADLPGFIYTDADFVAATDPLNYDADADVDAGSPGSFGNTINSTGPVELLIFDELPEVAGSNATVSFTVCGYDADTISPCTYDDFIVLEQVGGTQATIAVDSVMAESGCATFSVTMPMITECDTLFFEARTDTLTSNTVSIFVKEVVHFEPFICNALTWSIENVDGQQTWECDTTNQYISINTFGDTNTVSEDWIISPKLVLSTFDQVSMNFSTRERFDGPPLQLLFSTDYAGTGDPNLANWTSLSFDFDDSQNGFAFAPWTPSGDVALPIEPSIYVAFKYTGFPNDSVAQWLVNDVVVSGCPKVSGGLMINEIWNDQSFSGPTCFTHGAFIELLVVATLEDTLASSANLQNWIIEPSTTDNGHARIKSGCLTDVPIGSVIVIYNADNVPAGIPGPDEMDLNGDLVYFIPSNSACLEYTTDATYPGATYMDGNTSGCLHAEQISVFFGSLPYIAETRNSQDASVFDALNFIATMSPPGGATGLDCGNITDPNNELIEIPITPGAANTPENGLIIEGVQEEAGNGMSGIPDSAAINYVNYLTPGLTPACGEIVQIDCADTLVLQGPLSVIDTLAAAEFIETIDDVIVDMNAVFNAPEILLGPGFEVPLGAEFLTILDGCDNGSGSRSSNIKVIKLMSTEDKNYRNIKLNEDD